MTPRPPNNSSPTHRRLTLTFDNGPTAGVTDGVLDRLAERGVTASFFVVGTALRKPDGQRLARRAVAEGHRVGHHSVTHSVLLGDVEDPAAAGRSEIADLASDTAEFDLDAKLYRPDAAGGVLDHHVFSRAALEYVEAHGYTCVLWNCVPHDWDDPVGWVDRAMADIMRQDWTVVVLHDIDTGAMPHVARFLDELSARDVEIVPDFPLDCVPIRAGVPAQPLDQLTKETVS
jgi:peptidoglycan/xylan/chitin deacetylase (PgdA/CDA1 family)